MDKERKKLLKKDFQSMQRKKLQDSLPIAIDELKGLFTFLDRKDAPACDHTLRETIEFLEIGTLTHQRSHHG